MPPLAILVVWKFLNFGRPEVDIFLFLKKFQDIYLLPGETWIAETAAKVPKGFVRKKCSQGRPLGEGLGKKLGKKKRDRLELRKIPKKCFKKAVFTQSIFIRLGRKFVPALFQHR